MSSSSARAARSGSAATSWARRSPSRSPRCAPTPRDRPALAGAASRLARARRPLPEDPGDPGGDRLPDPDPAQARCRARVRRRAHGGQMWAGHHLPGRRRGRHGRRPAHRHRGDGHPADGGDSEARRALEDVGLADEIDLVVAGGSETAATSPRRSRSVRRRWPSATRRSWR